jgi:ferredoxin
MMERAKCIGCGVSVKGCPTDAIELAPISAVEFLKQAANELPDEQWKRVTSAKLPSATELLKSFQRARQPG